MITRRLERKSFDLRKQAEDYEPATRIAVGNNACITSKSVLTFGEVAGKWITEMIGEMVDGKGHRISTLRTCQQHLIEDGDKHLGRI